MRLVRVALVAVAAATSAFVAGCQSPDVGQRCAIDWGTGTAPTPESIQGDYLETGNFACDNLVCIVSPATTGQYASCAGTQCGYCSKPCVSDRDCFTSQTGLVCRQMVLDDAFIAWLRANGKDQYLGDAQYSKYCAIPLQ
jgi:hypothetical protein